MAKGREELRSAFLNKKSSFISKLTRALWISSLAMMMSPLMIQKSFAATSTWSALPADNDWNNVGNWSAGVPTDVAEFNFSPITSLDLTAVTPGVNQIVFNVAATDPQYTINTSGFTLDISNTGITNNSAVVQTFNVNGGSLRFNTTASASTGSSNVSIINGNLLEFRDTSTASTATITNNFVLAFSNSSTANAANITNNPGSELAFNTDSTAGSATITNSGNTNFFNSSKAGTSHITNNLSHFLDFFDTSTAEGSTITNNGTTEFFNTSTAGSSTLTNNGSLNFRNTSTAGSSTITNNGSVNFLNSSTAGSSTITNNTTTNFLSTSTAGSSTITNNGTLTFNSTTSSGSATVINNLGGTVNLNQNTTLGSLSGAGNVSLNSFLLTTGGLGNSETISGVLSGGGASGLTKVGAGMLTLSGANTYGGVTTVSGGILRLIGSLGGEVTVDAGGTFTVDGTSLTFANNVTNNGTTNFNTTASAGSSVITNNGTLAFNSTTSSELATVINNLGGTVDLNQNTTLGFLSGEGNVNLETFNLTTGVLEGDETISGVISDTGGGSFTKTGIGALTFTNTNTYTGPTNVNQGTLILNGSLPNSAVTVANGATLMGNGSMNSLTLGGTISPGNSIGTLTVAGDYTMLSTSTYDAEVDANGTSDLIAVGGAAQLNGTLNLINANPAVPFTLNQAFTILTASGGVSGTFAALTGLTPFRIQYLSNAVNVLMNPSFVGPFGSSDNSNPARTARYFDTFADTVPASSDLGGVIAILDGMLVTGDTAGLTNAFNQIQPSQYRETGMLSFLNSELVSKTVQTQQQYLRETHRLETELKQLEGVSSERVAGFQKLVNDIHSKGFNFASARATTVGPKKSALAFLAPHGAEGSGMPGNQRIRFGDSSAWFQSYGQVHEKNSSHGNKGVRSRTGGISIGADHQVYKNTFVGLFTGLSTTPFEWKGGRGSGHMKSYYGGVYGTWMDDCGLYVDGQVIAGQDRFHSHRNIQFANINRKAKENHHGNQFSVDTEVGYAIGLPYMTVQPYVDASYMFVRENGFTEKGADSLDFKVKGKTSQFARGAIGTQFYRTFVTCDTLIRPAIQLAYVHKQPLGHHEAIKGGLVDEPQTLSVLGDNKKRNQFAPGASLTAQFQNGMYVIANVSGEVFSGQNAGEALVRVGYDF